MYYCLNETIALRSWRLVPYAYYIRGVRNAFGLKKEAFDLLSLCDGAHDLEESELLHSFVESGLVTVCEPGTRTLSSWQKRRCDNRYFPALNWMITGKCNYNCLHCFNASDASPLVSEFSLEEAERLLDEAQKCGIHAFTITGGEPMLHRHFFEILEGIYRRGMFVEELNTNGYFIDQQALERMKKIGCRPLIKISFDGLGHHDWLRSRKGAEEDAIRAIRLCVEAGFRVKAQTNVHRWNLDSMLPTAEFLDSIGVEEMRIIRTTEVPRWNQNAAGATLELEEYFDRMLEFAQQYCSGAHQMKVDIWQFLALLPKNRTYVMKTVECRDGEYRDTIPVCRGNRGMVAVAANGNVFPCLQMSGYYEARGDILGNVKEHGLQSLLQQGPYLSEICTTVKTLAQSNPQCAACPYFKYCCGGCRAIALSLTGDKLGVDPSKCLFFKCGYYGKIVRALETWRNGTVLADLETELENNRN